MSRCKTPFVVRSGYLWADQYHRSRRQRLLLNNPPLMCNLGWPHPAIALRYYCPHTNDGPLCPQVACGGAIYQTDKKEEQMRNVVDSCFILKIIDVSSNEEKDPLAFEHYMDIYESAEKELSKYPPGQAIGIILRDVRMEGSDGRLVLLYQNELERLKLDEDGKLSAISH